MEQPLYSKQTKKAINETHLAAGTLSSEKAGEIESLLRQQPDGQWLIAGHVDNSRTSGD
jgi:hypothetical protein